MMCYLDKTFCASPNCKNECGRKYTKEIHDAAVKWWGSEEAPIALAYFCGGEPKDEKEEQRDSLRLNFLASLPRFL